jgi:hypothetical protein
MPAKNEVKGHNDEMKMKIPNPSIQTAQSGNVFRDVSGIFKRFDLTRSTSPTTSFRSQHIQHE